MNSYSETGTTNTILYLRRSKSGLSCIRNSTGKCKVHYLIIGHSMIDNNPLSPGANACLSLHLLQIR